MCSGSALKLFAIVGSAVARTVPSNCSMNIALATINETVRALAACLGGGAEESDMAGNDRAAKAYLKPVHG